jgi:hypothetical protein
MKKKSLCILFALVLLLQNTTHVNAEQSSEELLGVDFLNDLTFFGESTTTHLRQRSKISPSQVWANQSGTARLDSNVAYRPIVDPQNGRPVTPVELAEKTRPSLIVLSFGLNGITAFSQDVEDYLQKYQKLMDELVEASPQTRFLIQSIYPVAKADLQRDWKFSASPREINEKIELLNASVKRYCERLDNADFVDTSCKLKDKDGFLRPEYTTDGIHLTEAAYEIILTEIELQRKELAS